jgi:hypothetical protein
MYGYMMENRAGARTATAFVLRLDGRSWRVVSRVSTRGGAARTATPPVSFIGDDLLVATRRAHMKRLSAVDACPHPLAVTRYRLVGSKYVPGRSHQFPTAVAALDEFFDAVITKNSARAKVLCPETRLRLAASEFIIQMSALMPRQSVWGGSIISPDTESVFTVDDHGIFKFALKNGRWILTKYQAAVE